jgi:hypothetical protein
MCEDVLSQHGLVEGVCKSLSVEENNFYNEQKLLVLIVS